MRKNLKVFLLALLLSFGYLLLSSTVQAVNSSSLPWLKTVGNQIVRADTNQGVLLRGANVMRSEWDTNMTWEERALPQLASWHGNIVLRGFASQPVNNGDTTYLNLLDQEVVLAQAWNMYVVFVWRSVTIDGPQPNQPDAEAQQALVALATRYRGNPNVMYGLQVEPHAVTWAALRPQFEAMVDTIRAASAPYTPLIFVPGSDYSQDVSGAITDPVRRENIVYKPHAYQPSTNYQAQFGDTYAVGLPVFVGEVAPVEGATMTDMHTFFNYTASRNIGWAAWVLDYNIPTDSLLNQADLSPTDPWGLAVREALLTTPVITPVVIGDINGDGKVDIFDYNLLVTDYGAVDSPADLNHSGRVDIFDYNLLIQNFGR